MTDKPSKEFIEWKESYSPEDPFYTTGYNLHDLYAAFCAGEAVGIIAHLEKGGGDETANNNP